MELLDLDLVELLGSEYDAATQMPPMKDIYSNWTKKRMCNNYWSYKKLSRSQKYTMSMPEEIFQSIGHAKMLSKLDLRSGYHQLPIPNVDRKKEIILGYR